MPVILSSRDELKSTLLFTWTTVFNAFACFGVISIVATLAPALISSRVKRPMTWFGVLAAWLVYSLSYLLLIGNQFGPDPPLGLCILQAAFIYATSPLCAMATMCFAIDFFLRLTRGGTIGRRTENALVALPWILGHGVAVEAILSASDTTKILRDTDHFYCHITSLIPSIINIVIVISSCLTMTVLEIYTAIHLYRNWAVFKRLAEFHAEITLSTFFRLALFSMIVAFSLGISVFSAAHIGKSIPVFSVVLTTLPTLSALCFGTQRDILHVWLFWKQTRKDSEPRVEFIIRPCLEN